jgi:hypothetical protein
MVWIGQIFSMIGSQMTHFAMGIWAWEKTGQATPLADGVFEPLFSSSDHWLSKLLHPIIGTGPGTGMSVLILISGILVAGVGLGAYQIRQILCVEKLIPDHDEC